MVSLDPKGMRTVDVYKFLIGSIVPRPIAFVSTVNTQGEGNLAPFSFFNGLSSNPPCVMISVTRKRSGEKKDTLRNIEETGEFVVNSANKWLLEALVHCSVEYPYGVDELTKVGLTPQPSTKVRPVRVKESAVHMECKLFKSVELGEGGPGSTNLIIGEIQYLHIAKEAYQDGRVLFDFIQPIGRLGGFQYGEITRIYEIPIPEL